MAWAREALADPALVVLDCETTGLFGAGRPDPRVVELAVLAGDGSVLLDTLVDPGAPIPAAASALHHITDETVAGAPSFAQILTELEMVLTGRRVVIYNARYDTEVLALELARAHGVSPADIGGWWAARGVRIECAMQQAAAHRGEWDHKRGRWRYPRLANHAADAHRALSDCHATLAAITEIADGRPRSWWRMF
ncbi:hypothetical protein A5789_27770 [Nocardia sp. 852002-51101_SCH5132738]|nr:hypothetical protein A5789_27770 [Nocardia sp. 852002-51101_SCH5132738]